MRMEHKPKSLSDIKKDFLATSKTKIKLDKQGKAKKKDVESALVESLLLERAKLIAYYSTKEGRMEIDNSPQKDYSTEEAVELLMMDLRTMAKRELENYE